MSVVYVALSFLGSHLFSLDVFHGILFIKKAFSGRKDITDMLVSNYSSLKKEKHINR